ncbi:hypothetical protein J6590_074451 [Homalodisca vitripennis]|nr:hypothetical protein J6590_074451 [Homalodisca vitripennis]
MTRRCWRGCREKSCSSCGIGVSKKVKPYCTPRDDSDDEPVDDSVEDPNYVVSDNELNQSESDDSFDVDEPQLEDEDDIHYSVENYLVQESEDDFFGGKMVAYGAERSHPSSAEHLNITF